VPTTAANPTAAPTTLEATTTTPTSADAPALGDQSAGTGDEAAGQSPDGQQPGTGTNTPVTLPAATAVPGAEAPVGVAGVAPTAPTAPAAPVADAQPPAPASPVPLADQLATRIIPLRLDADGVHRLTVHLHPADLGPVQVIAEIRNGEISVQLSSSTDAGHESLRNALDDLRRELQQSGFSNTSLDLRQGGQDQARQQPAFPGGNGPRREDRSSGEPAGPVPAEPSPARTDDPNRLDIQA
jgi:flagellar hook-length control protein FliK